MKYYRKGVPLEEMGMTNEQYKGFLLDDLEKWERVRDMAEKSDNAEILAYAEKQIATIGKKLEF